MARRRQSRRPRSARRNPLVTFIRRSVKLAIWLIVLLPVAVVVALVASVEKTPAVTATRTLSVAEVERAKAILKQHDPRRAKEGEVKTAVLSASELNLVAGQLAQTFGGAAASDLRAGQVDVMATFKVPKTPLGEYFNVSLAFGESTRVPKFRRCKIGRFSVPVGVANFVMTQTLNILYSRPGYTFAEDVIRGVKITDTHASLTYEWSSQLEDALRSTLVSRGDQERIKEFHNQLTRVLAQGGFGARVSLVNLVQPLFAFADERSMGGDPIADNQAAVLVLAAYVNGKDIQKLAPDMTGLAQPAKIKVTVQNRADLAQHFTISAALAVKGSGAISRTIGLYKEVDDSRGGSGFSFTDLLADNAGTMFGELCVDSNRSAKTLQRLIARGISEADLVPSVAGLPEGLSESQFAARYGEVGSAAYNQVLDQISTRLAASALYQ